jgi:glycosyltransferase involved in cell wall biosynthesis
MYEGHLVGVVVPAYNEEGLVGDVIRTMPAYVDRMYVVDDASTDDTYAEIERAIEHANRTRDRETDRWSRTAVLLRHETNRGVGGAIKTGYQQAVRDGVDVVAVMGGDGQMPAEQLSKILQPVIDGRVGYAKGNRLITEEHQHEMPRFRYVGNVILSYLTKIASGYWGISDPQNGFTAISTEALERIDFEELYEDYGYCNELLVRLNVANVRVAEVPQPPIYGDEESHIRYSTYIPRVSMMLLRSFCWRLWRLSTTGLHPVALGYGIAGVLFAGGTTALMRCSGSAETESRSTLATVSLVTSIAVGLVAMILDRDGNRSLSTVVSAAEEPTADGQSDAEAPTEARNADTRSPR